MNTKRAIELLERMRDPEPWEPKITDQAAEALDMAIKAMKEEEKRKETDAALRAHINDLENRNARLHGIIAGLKFAVRCNGVSGNEVIDGPL